MSKLLPRRWELKRSVIWVVCVTSIALLLLILGAARLVASQSYTGLDWSMIDGTIYAVEAGSPAAVAGLQPGDTIVSIDSQPLARGLARYTKVAPGQTIDLHVRREGQIHFFSLSAGSLTPSRLLRRLEPLFIALGFALCGFIAWAYKPYDRQTILFLAFNHLEAAALSLGLLSSLGHRSGALGFPVALYFLSPVLVHFHLVFPRAKPFAGRRLMLMALYTVASVGAALWIGSYGRGANAKAYVFTRLGMRFYFAAAVVISIGLLLYTYRASRPADQRRIRLVVFSTVLAFAPLVGLAILPEALTGVPLVAYELTFPGLFLIPLAYATAIRRHDLLSIDRLVNRGVVHLTPLLVLALVYLVLAVGLSHLWPTSTWIERPLVWGLVTLLIAMLFVPLRTWLQRWADRLFYGGWYDYQAVVHETGQALTTASEPVVLARALLDGLTATMRLRCACLLLAEESGPQVSACVPAGEGCPLLAGQPLTLPRRGALARRLAEEVGLVYGIQLRRALEGEPLSRVEGALLACPHGRLWVPLRREGQLLAALVLGPKPGEEPFGAEDRAILESVARETAVVMENLSLVAEVEQRAREVGRLHGELSAAGEAERKRVARELHDGVLQELIAAYRGLRNRPHLDPEAAEAKVAETEAKLRALMDEVRRICADLRPAVLDVLGLAEAVRSQAEVFGLHTGIAVRVTVAGDAEARLPEAVEVCLFRVLQEALHNVEQHARASAVEVVLEMPVDLERGSGRVWGGKKGKREKVEKGSVVLVVRDDGCGFVVPRRLGLLLDQDHFGLVGLRERLALVGGTLGVSSGPGRGTELVAQVPLETGEQGDKEKRE